MEQEADNPKYDILPPESKGQLADNPHILNRWIEEETTGKIKWAYLMLCRDRINETLTWRMLCNEFNVPMWIKLGLKPVVDYVINTDPDRELEGIELLCRSNYMHMFLTQE